MSEIEANAYHIIFKGERSGPYPADSIVEMLLNREISMLHRVSDGVRTFNMDDFLEHIGAEPVRTKPSTDKPGGALKASPLGRIAEANTAHHSAMAADSEAVLPDTADGGDLALDSGRTDPCAVAAFALMCLGFLIWALSAIPAVYLAHIALERIPARPGTKGMGLALAALIIGYAQIAVSIIALLVYLIFG